VQGTDRIVLIQATGYSFTVVTTVQLGSGSSFLFAVDPGRAVACVVPRFWVRRISRSWVTRSNFPANAGKREMEYLRVLGGSKKARRS